MTHPRFARPMRPMALLVLALALAALAAPVQAQPPTFSQPYQVRAAAGDIPTTPAVEPAGTWNVEQRLEVSFDNATAKSYHFTLPAGATLANATCDCARTQHGVANGQLTFTILEQTASGKRTIRIVTQQPLADVQAGTIVAPVEATADRVVVLYVPAGSAVSAAAGFEEVGTAPSDPSKSIHFATFTAQQPMPQGFWYAVHPATTAAGPSDEGGAGSTAWLLPALAGLAVGMAVWALLVARGVVQAKSRRQVAQTAAHVEAAATDPPAVLEGKKRALLAALKEVELAKQANEMPLEVYDAVKADLKKQAVTVMRALESGEAKA